MHRCFVAPFNGPRRLLSWRALVVPHGIRAPAAALDETSFTATVTIDRVPGTFAFAERRPGTNPEVS